MAVVEEYKLGNTVIRIHDDTYKDKRQEDIDKIFKNYRINYQLCLYET